MDANSVWEYFFMFFKDLNNMFLCFFEWTCQKVFSKSFVLNASEWIHIAEQQHSILFGLSENDGHENDRPSKLQDMKIADQIAGHEKARHEIGGHSF